MPPPVERRKRPQDGISQVQKVAAVELGFRGAPGCSQGTWIYIAGRSRSMEPRGAHEGGGRAHHPRARLAPSWPPRLFLDVHSKSPGLRLFQKIAPEGFIPFGLRLIFLFSKTLK